MCSHRAWCWFPSPVTAPVRPGPVLSRQMHTASDASSKETREASGNGGRTHSVHSAQEKQSRQRQPCSEQAKQGQHKSEGGLGYVHRWWRASRTLHLPFGSCHLTEKTNLPLWKGSAITLFRGNCRLRCEKSLDKSLMAGCLADG